MRERAFTEKATAEDLENMAKALRDGLEAGAIGFSTSKNPSHSRPGGEPVASRLADWAEIEALVGVMADMNLGMFEISRGASASARFVRRVQHASQEPRAEFGPSCHSGCLQRCE